MSKNKGEKEVFEVKEDGTEVLESTVEEESTPSPTSVAKKKSSKKTSSVKKKEEVKTLKDFRGDKAKYTEYLLSTQPKVQTMIPREGLARGAMTHPFIINGYKVELPVGEFIEVPLQIAQMIKERFLIDHKVSKFLVIDGKVPNIDPMQ